MNKVFTLISFLFFAMTAQAQLVISEIMYNPPESGEDSLEYIELLNVSANPVNLEGYKFSAGVTFTFPSSILNAGQSVLVAKDTTAMKLIFGVNAFQFSGALSNSGESIVLVDVQDNVIDEVTYDDSAPWPLDPDEGGSSLVLCDASTNNADGANWSAAKNNTGIILNGKELKCSPGLANAISCNAEPTIFIDVMNFSFSPKDVTIQVGETVRWTNKGGNHNINGSQTVFPNNPTSFGNGAPAATNWTYDFTFTKAGLYEYQCDPHAASGMKGTVTVGSPNIYPVYPIASVTSVNQEGVADSLNVKCQISGYVHGYNLRPGALQFTLIDALNNGIGIFNGTTDFGYTVKEGDEVVVKGIVNQFNGLTQLIADDVKLVSGGHAQVTPKQVQSLNEEDESSLVTIQGALTYVDPAEWKGNGTSFNVNVTNGQQVFLMRIDNDCSLSAQPAPAAPFKLTGIIGQFDAMIPYDEGYQIFPRYAADIVPVSSVTDTEDSYLAVSPNPASGFVKIYGASNISKLVVYNASAQVVAELKDTEKLDVSAFGPGLYVLKVTDDYGVRFTKMMVIR